MYDSSSVFRVFDPGVHPYRLCQRPEVPRNRHHRDTSLFRLLDKLRQVRLPMERVLSDEFTDEELHYLLFLYSIKDNYSALQFF